MNGISILTHDRGHLNSFFHFCDWKNLHAYPAKIVFDSSETPNDPFCIK